MICSSQASQASIFVCLEIDLAQQDIVNLDKRKADPTAITLAKAVAEEIAEADWNRLRYSTFRTNSIGPSSYEAMILSPSQGFAVLVGRPEPERTLMPLAAGTGLRISECLGLQWQDVSFDGSLIHVRRTWSFMIRCEPLDHEQLD
jgi:integrase